MFIGICGSRLAGKKTVAQYLVEHHGFRLVHIKASAQFNETVSSPSKTRPGHDRSTDQLINGTQKEADVNGDSAWLPIQPRHQSIIFETSDALLEYVTTRWRDRWITTDIPSEAVLDAFSRRPFFLLISVDAPLIVRWERCQQKGQTGNTPPGGPSLETFTRYSDKHLYDPITGHLPLMSRATVRLLNTSSDLAHLYATLGKVDLLNADRLRPSWDSYFMALASLAAQRSNCMKRRVGCVLVREKRVISTGYNGTPRGLVNCGEGGCGRCNGGLGSGVGLATCLCIHAEENALLEAGRERIREGAILYCDTCPCLTCSIKIVQVGISEVVYSQGYSMDGETAAVFREAGVQLRQFVPPANGLIHLEKMELY